MTEPVALAVPGSKSLTQRALVLAALADGPTEIAGALDCDDARLLRRALEATGARIDDRPGGWLVVPGELRLPRDAVFCGNAGTTLRFAAALALLADGPLLLDGDERMRRRPVGDLADALERLGAEVRYQGQRGFPPLTVRRRGPPGSRVAIDASRSSQFVSALLLVAPRLPGGLAVETSGSPVSGPYIELTVDALRAFGAVVDVSPAGWRVAPGPLRGGRFEVEGDWSSAAFLLVAARISGRPVRIANLRDDSRQADRAVVGFLERLDAPGPCRIDLGACPDLLPPLAAASAFAAAPVELRGVAHARLKESDRIAALAEGLRRVGANVAEFADGMRIEPLRAPVAAALDPRADHRIAMAFGLLGLRIPGTSVRDPGCVTKSYPGFWADLERFR
jgi:3-phosphoshikimate 1-carboxyvinyltransferase